MARRATALDAAMYWTAKLAAYAAEQLLLRIRRRLARRRLRTTHGPVLKLVGEADLRELERQYDATIQAAERAERRVNRAG